MIFNVFLADLIMAKRILLVDDEPDIRITLSRRLKANGYEIDTAENGMEALEKVKVSLPDLVILDVMLPELNGYQVCRTLREDAKTRDLPVLMLTAKAQQTDKFWGEKIGVTAYLTKPVDENILIKTIDEILRSG